MAPQNLRFFQEPLKIVAMTVFGPRCLLEAFKSLQRAYQEPPKSLPRAVPEPSKGSPQPSRASHQAPKRIPRACFADLSTFLSCSAIILLHTFSKKRDVLVSGIAMIEIRFYSAGPLQHPRIRQTLFLSLEQIILPSRA